MANLSNINNILRTGSLGVGINRDPLGAFEISSATKPGVKMFNTSTNGKTYEAYSDANGNYIIYDQDADDNRFVINTSGNATFAGQVIASSSSSGDYVRMYGGSGTAQWDIYGNGENLRFSENSGGGGHVDIDTNLIVDGNVGIGTTSPGSYDNESDDLVVFNSTTPGITIATDNAASRGALRFADGTSGNETYRGALEYNHSGDIMSFRTAGVQRMNLTSDGNLVIGGGSAYSGTGVTSLTVNNNSYPTLALGTLSANRFAIISYGTYNLFASSNNFVFDSGNVGIGTTSPTAKLTINNGSTAGGSLLTSSSSSYTAHFIANTGSGNAGIYCDASNGDFIGSDYVFFGQHDDKWAQISTGASASGIRFMPADSIRMVINNSGNVGIGTTSPSNKLNVIEGTGTWETVEIQSSSTTGCGVTLVGADTSVQWSIIANASTGGAGANNLGFHLTGAGSSGGSTGYKMTIQASSGNVGIGNTSPNNKLEISDTGTGYGTTYLKISRGADSSTVARVAGIKMGNTASNDGSNWLVQAESSLGYFDDADLNFYHNGGGTAVSKFKIKKNAEVISQNHQAGSHGFVLNGLNRVSNTGYVAGTGTLSITYDCLSQGSFFIQCVFNHYGFISSYGCARVAVFANGPNLQIQDLDNITSSNGGSWTITRVSNTRFTVAKTAGSYSGGGYYMVNITGTGLKYT